MTIPSRSSARSQSLAGVILAVGTVGLFNVSCQQLPSSVAEFRQDVTAEPILEILEFENGLVRALPLRDGYLSLVAFDYLNQDNGGYILEDSPGSGMWPTYFLVEGVPFVIDVSTIVALSDQRRGAGKNGLSAFDNGVFVFMFMPPKEWNAPKPKLGSGEFLELYLNRPVRSEDDIWIPQMSGQP